MLQGFFWESHRYGHPERFPKLGEKHWYQIIREAADKIQAARFDMIWLPPPCYAGQNSAGYNPKEYFNLANSYGSFDEHRAALEALLKAGVEPIADIVINHRDASKGWAQFKNPDWGLWAICGDDECFSDEDSEAKDTPPDERGANEEAPKYRPHGDYAYANFRDIDHTSPLVRKDILRYLLELKSLGYRGWRYDMVHGFNASWVALYNRRTKPTFSVGEYDWGEHVQQRGWIWASATTPTDFNTASSVFDFSTQFALKANKGKYGSWYGYGNGTGMMGDNTDGLPWRNHAVTFLENHDTGYRTNDDGTPQTHHDTDSFANNFEVEQGYAYILTHPGVPCVYWKHYFEWGEDLQGKIKALINARKIAGVNSGSVMHTQNNARAKGVYAAKIIGSFGQLYVRIGGTDSDWDPGTSNYRDFREYARGTGWKVWVSISGNPEPAQAPVRVGLPIPTYQSGEKIAVPEDWVN